MALVITGRQSNNLSVNEHRLSMGEETLYPKHQDEFNLDEASFSLEEAVESLQRMTVQGNLASRAMESVSTDFVTVSSDITTTRGAWTWIAPTWEEEE